MSLALASARRSTNRGSAQDGEPSGMRMSQNIRAESPAPFFHGSTWNVPGSGLAIMSLSEARAKPSIAEPSKPMPSAKAPSSSAGATATDLRKPSTSVNHSRTNRISRSSSVRSTNSCCLSTVAPLRPPLGRKSPPTTFRRRYPRHAARVHPADSGATAYPGSAAARSGASTDSPGHASVQGAARGPLRPGDAPLVGLGGERQGDAGVLDVDDVAPGERAVEVLRVGRGHVDAAVRDVLLALSPHRPRRRVDELAVHADPH